MQDLISAKVQTEPSRESLPMPSKPQQWLSKDRLWNLVFWFGMSLGLTLGSLLRFTLEMPKAALAINLITILGVPLLIMLTNGTRFVSKDTFINSNNDLLTKKQLPTGNFIWSTILAIAATGYFANKTAAQQALTALPTFIGVFSGFSLYFIFKNCPISILFNRKLWHYLADNAPARSIKPSERNRSFSSYTSENLLYSPVYRHHPSNIYHRNR